MQIGSFLPSAHFGSEFLLQRFQDIPYNLLGVLVGQGLTGKIHAGAQDLDPALALAGGAALAAALVALDVQLASVLQIAPNNDILV